jgi:dienelactone hydrolase
MFKTGLLILASLLITWPAGPAAAVDLLEQPLRIPTASAGGSGLEGFMVRPNDAVAHPLALLTHGTPRETRLFREISAPALVPEAREFARRGWTAVVVVRRGYGTSGGGYEEDARACSSRADYYYSGRQSAEDLRGAVQYLSRLAQVDASRIISVGVSTGGFATVALTADPPPGLRAAISFAGGRGSRRPDDVCNSDDLVNAFARFGRTSRIPMLWVYSENDHYFGPKIAAQLYDAFTRAGGGASFIRAPAFHKDGHGLFSYAGTPIWAPIVDAFLAQQGLKLRDDLLPLPTPPDVAPPAQLSAEGAEAFRAFLTFPGYRAFAVSPGGHYGYVFARRSAAKARKDAEENCNENTLGRDRCRVVTWDAN